MKDESGGKMMWEFVVLRPKMDDNEKKQQQQKKVQISVSSSEKLHLMIIKIV